MKRHLMNRPTNLIQSIALSVLFCAVFMTSQAQTATRYLCVFKKNNLIFEKKASLIDSIDVNAAKVMSFFDKNKVKLYQSTYSTIDSILIRNYVSTPALNTSKYQQMTLSINDENGAYQISTTGSDPFVYSVPLTKALLKDQCVLTFEYKSTSGIDDLQIFFCEPVSESRSLHAGAIPNTAGKWKTYSLNLKTSIKDFSWGNTGQYLRFDFGRSAGLNIQLRGINIRYMNAEELAEQNRLDSIENHKYVMDAHIKKYLSTSFSSKVTRVEVKRTSVVIAGKTEGEGKFALVEVAPYEDVTEETSFKYRTELTESDFSITLPRRFSREGITYDRALSKWAIVAVKDQRDSLVSHARYADSITPNYQAAKGELLGKKGIACGVSSLYFEDFDNLNVHSMNVNVVLSNLVARSGETSYAYGGRTYYINYSQVQALDQMLLEAKKRNMIVNAILLCPSGSYFKDPENTGGYYTMPNMTAAENVNIYAAVLEFMAKRYSSGAYGRIHNWIMHNEVDMDEDWTNMGKQPETRLNDRYVKSMRMCYNIVRQYDQHAWILGSYTHNWNMSSSVKAPLRMLNQTVLFSQQEGDFRWGIAYHPYPINLTRPAFWINDVNQATYAKNSTYVTFRNPEVINEWILRPEHFYQDGTKRLLFFTEQGANSPSYSDSDVALQAAGAAWIWKKVKDLEGIDGIQWHNWADNRQEFGLRIGLRSFAEGNYGELQAKPAWYVWQAADSETEEEVFAPYLKVIGIPSWDIIQPIP